MPGPFGLVLSGGGARGAYQAGVLRGLAELLPPGPLPFQILSGTSAGALNAVFLASHADDFRAGTKALAELWTGLTTSRVIETGFWKMLTQALRVLRNLVGGGVLYTERRNHLLDATPLVGLIRDRVDFGAIERHVTSGLVRSLAITTTNYATGSTVTHVASAAGIDAWDRGNNISVPARITAEHVLASSAIPVFFPPVRVGTSFHGDGALRQMAPFRPALHLGAERIFAIHVKHHDPRENVRERNLLPMRGVSLADIGGALLDSIFLDAVDMDLDRLERINRTLALMTDEQRSRVPDHLRIVPVKLLRPSLDPAELASDQLGLLPVMLRYLLRGLGAKAGKKSDVLSYLAFEGSYCARLVELGVKDARANAESLLALLA